MILHMPILRIRNENIFPFFSWPAALFDSQSQTKNETNKKMRFVRTVDYIRNFVFLCDYKVKNVRVEVEQKTFARHK